MAAADALRLFALILLGCGGVLALRSWLGWQTLAWERPWDDSAGKAERNVARASRE